MTARPLTAGRTLMEVLIACGILGLLTAIGIPSFSRIRAPYARATATRQIAADLQLARQRAIARNVRYRVNFNTSGGTYTIEADNAGNWVAETAPQKLASGVALGTVTPTNPVFDTRGMLAADVSVPVTVSGSGTKTVTTNVLGKTTVN